MSTTELAVIDNQPISTPDPVQDASTNQHPPVTLPVSNSDHFDLLPEDEQQDLLRRRENLSAVLLREHRKFSSDDPNSFLTEALVTSTGHRLEYARIVQDAWYTQRHIVSATSAIPDTSDISYGYSIDDSAYIDSQERQLLKEHAKERAEAVFGDMYAAIKLAETLGDDSKPVKERKTRDKGPKVPKQPKYDVFRKNGRINATGFDSENQFAAEIYNYAIWRARTTEEFRNATVTEDVATDFTMHALKLIADGKYEEQGKLKGWLGYVWDNWVWKAGGLEALVQERNTVFGLQRTLFDEKGSEYRTEAGYRLEDNVFFDNEQTDEDVEDRLSESLTHRHAKLLPRLSDAQKSLIEQKRSGQSDAEIAAQLDVSTRTVERQFKRVKDKAGTLIDIKACADDSLPFESELVQEMFAESQEAVPGVIDSICGSADDPLLNDEQAAERLCISPATLRSWRCRGIGPNFVKMGAGKKSPVRYSSDDIDEFVAQCRQVPPVRVAQEN